jgi:hypothetical protein
LSQLLLSSQMGSYGNTRIKTVNGVRTDGDNTVWYADDELWFDTSANTDYAFEFLLKCMGTTTGGGDWRFYHTGTTDHLLAANYLRNGGLSTAASPSTATIAARAYTESQFTTTQAMATGTAPNFQIWPLRGCLRVGGSGGRFGVEWRPNSGSGQVYMWDKSLLFWQAL